MTKTLDLFKPDNHLIDAPGAYTKEMDDFPKPPYIAVFERDGKKLLYMAETHRSVESFNMVNASFKQGPMPGAFVVEYENAGRKLHDLDELAPKIKLYQKLSGIMKLGNTPKTISEQNMLNTLGYGAAMAKQHGVPVVLAGMSSDDRQSALNEMCPGYKIDIHAAVMATPNTGNTNMMAALGVQILNRLNEIYPDYKFDVQKLRYIFEAGRGQNAGDDISKLFRPNMVQAWNETFPDLPIDIHGIDKILDSDQVKGFEFLKQNPDTYYKMTQQYRDPYMLDKISDALNQYDTVWAMFGEGHFRSQYKNLVKWMGKPKYFIEYASGDHSDTSDRPDIIQYKIKNQMERE